MRIWINPLWQELREENSQSETRPEEFRRLIKLCNKHHGLNNVTVETSQSLCKSLVSALGFSSSDSCVSCRLWSFIRPGKVWDPDGGTLNKPISCWFIQMAINLWLVIRFQHIRFKPTVTIVLLLRPINGSIRLQLQVKALSTVQLCHDPLQLGLCEGRRENKEATGIS